MKSPAQTQHDTQLLKLAEDYRRDGYEVIVEPDPKVIPFDLGGYHPDLLARKAQAGVLVEFKSRADRLSVDRLRSVAEEVRRHPDWHFVLVTPQDIPSMGLPGEEEPLSWGEIEDRVERALRLEELQERDAAYLALWIAFEKLLRFQARRVALPVDRLTPSIVIRQLYSQGEITMEQFDTALACLETRNRVVHGLPSPNLEFTIHHLTRLIRELLATWSEPDREVPSGLAGNKISSMEKHPE